MYAKTFHLQKQVGGLKNWIEALRIKKHLHSVEKQLRRADISQLSLHQQKNRSQTLRWLSEYIQEGYFPKNKLSVQRSPVFKDEHGNYCAVGHLLMRAGFDSYVSEIQRQDNLVHVNSVADQRYLDAITSLGITKSEAATIQPTYGFEPEPSGSNEVTLLKAAALALSLAVSIFSLLAITRINASKKWKNFTYLTVLSGTGLILLLFWVVVDRL